MSTDAAQQAQTGYEQSLADAHKDLQRFLQEDGHNVFDDKIWNDSTPLPGGDDINAILNTAAPGLQWFERAMVRYHRVWDVMKLPGFDSIVVPPLSVGNVVLDGVTIDTTQDPNDLMRSLEFKYYDQQRDMKIDSLRLLADKVKDISSGNGTNVSTNDITNDLQGVGSAVPEAWTGQAGDSAQLYLAGFHAHASQQNQYLQSLSTALDGLPDVLLTIVKDKANFVAQFNSDQMPCAGHAMKPVGGNSEDPVSNIITVAKGISYLDDNTRERAEDQLHLTDLSSGSTDNSQVRDACRKWLSEHFLFAVREAFVAFVHECQLADYYIKQAYQPVMDLLDNQNQTPFQQPQNPAQPSQPQQPSTPGNPSTPGTPGTPGPPGPGTTTDPASTTPAATTPASTTPTLPSSTTSATDPSQVLSGLAQVSQSVTSSVTSAVTQGLSSLSSTIQQGLDGLLGHNPLDPTKADANNPAGVNSSPTDGGKQLADLTLGGKRLQVEMEPNGALKLNLTGDDGTNKTYDLKLDQHGNPVVTTADNLPGAQNPGDPSHPGQRPPGPGDQPSSSQQPDGQQPGDQPGNPQPGAQSPGGQQPGSQQPDNQQPDNQQPGSPPREGANPSPPSPAVQAPAPSSPPSSDVTQSQPAPPSRSPSSGATLSEAGPL